MKPPVHPARDPGRLSRRRFIQTAGVTITLPMLPSLLHTPNASAQQACAPVRRFVAYMFPNGHKMDEHKPTGTGGAGSAWSLPPMLASMQDLKQHLTFVAGLENQQRRRENGDHAIGCGALLTARKPTKNEKVTNTSIDQVIAEAIGPCRGIASIQLGTHNQGPSDTFGTDYTRSISWVGQKMANADGTVTYPQGAATPLGKEIDPKKAFDRLFAGVDPGQTDTEAQMRLALRKSVLDTALAEGQSLLSRLNAEDRIKVDELFTGIRALETEIQNTAPPAACTPPTAPATGLTQNQNFQVQLTTMHELMAIALQCDITRVITFMMGDALNNRNLSFVPDVAAAGGEAADHTVSHHTGDAALVAKFRAMVLWKQEQIASFVRRLSTLTDADGQSVLHNSLVWISSDLADGNRHNHDDKPILLAGTLGGLVTPDRHVAFPTNRDYTRVKTYGDFFITLASLFGVNMTTFGDDGKEAIQWQS
jgi:hypothetical protein